MIISALSSAFIDLYRSSTAMSAGVRENDVAAHFGYKGREFVVRNAFRDAKRTNIKHLRKCLAILEEADLSCKSTRLDQRTLIEKSIVQMLASGSRE